MFPVLGIMLLLLYTACVFTRMNSVVDVVVDFFNAVEDQQEALEQ